MTIPKLTFNYQNRAKMQENGGICTPLMTHFLQISIAYFCIIV